MALITRRQFIRTATLTGATASLFPSLLSSAGPAWIGPANAKVGLGQSRPGQSRLGFIGLGERGRSHLAQALLRSDVLVPAICDPNPDSIARTNELVRQAGRPQPEAYTNGEEAFLQMLRRDDLDGVVISAPWAWHTPMAVAAMQAGKYVGVEVSATATLADSWALVDASEKTGMPCMMLENACYQRDVMAVLNMIRQGLFGQMLNAHCGYQHELRNPGFNTALPAEVDGQRNNLYPTHGLGPVAHWFNINRGNRLTHLTSVATKSHGRPRRKTDTTNNVRLGDVVTTSLQCANGEAIVLFHETSSPRPYSTGFRAQGTNGSWLDDNGAIYLGGQTPDASRAKPFAAYQRQFDHPLWQHYASTAETAGYGGSDYFVMQAFIESVRTKTPPPIDVYDAALWSAIQPLAEESIAGGSKTIAIPDFTRGKWQTNTPIFALTSTF